ncbi:MAG: hypothetical protein LBQ16_04715, partial [Gracilibacteraceae bacterium]|nr:hypothetical protein [Gracilibacteraceae bacterium]
FGDISVQIYISGLYVMMDPADIATVGQAVFYRTGSVQRGSYVYDDVKQETAIPIKDVPPRLFSEALLDIALASASSGESDADWQKDETLCLFHAS